jgi:hypothetical protein
MEQIFTDSLYVRGTALSTRNMKIRGQTEKEPVLGEVTVYS